MCYIYQQLGVQGQIFKWIISKLQQRTSSLKDIQNVRGRKKKLSGNRKLKKKSTQSKGPALPMSGCDDFQWMHTKLVHPGIPNLWLMVNWSVRYQTVTIILLAFLKHKGWLWGSWKSSRTTGADWEETGAPEYSINIPENLQKLYRI